MLCVQWFYRNLNNTAKDRHSGGTFSHHFLWQFSKQCKDVLLLQPAKPLLITVWPFTVTLHANRQQNKFSLYVISIAGKQIRHVLCMKHNRTYYFINADKYFIQSASFTNENLQSCSSAWWNAPQCNKLQHVIILPPTLNCISFEALWHLT